MASLYFGSESFVHDLRVGPSEGDEAFTQNFSLSLVIKMKRFMWPCSSDKGFDSAETPENPVFKEKMKMKNDKLYTHKLSHRGLEKLGKPPKNLQNLEKIHLFHRARGLESKPCPQTSTTGATESFWGLCYTSAETEENHIPCPRMLSIDVI